VIVQPFSPNVSASIRACAWPGYRRGEWWHIAIVRMFGANILYWSREEAFLPVHLGIERHARRRRPWSDLAFCRHRVSARHQCPLSGATRKTYARIEFFSVGPGTDIPFPTGWRRADCTDWLGKPTMPAPSEAKSDGVTHPGRGTLKWQIAVRPLTVY
jgi:hypothetical protein